MDSNNSMSKYPLFEHLNSKLLIFDGILDENRHLTLCQQKFIVRSVNYTELTNQIADKDVIIMSLTRTQHCNLKEKEFTF